MLIHIGYLIFGVFLSFTIGFLTCAVLVMSAKGDTECDTQKELEERA